MDRHFGQRPHKKNATNFTFVLASQAFLTVRTTISFKTENADPDCPRKNEVIKFWSFGKSLKKDAFGITTIRENGILKYDNLDKANICNKQFQSDFMRESDSEIP